MSGALLLAAMASDPVFFVYTTNISETRAVAASAGVQYQSDGDIEAQTVAAPNTDVGDWVSPKALAPGSYTIRCHVNSGTLDVGSSAQDSDLALSSTRTWSVSQSGSSGTATANITITIKDGGGNTVKSGSLTLTATVP